MLLINQFVWQLYALWFELSNSFGDYAIALISHVQLLKDISSNKKAFHVRRWRFRHMSSFLKIRMCAKFQINISKTVALFHV